MSVIFLRHGTWLLGGLDMISRTCGQNLVFAAFTTE